MLSLFDRTGHSEREVPAAQALQRNVVRRDRWCAHDAFLEIQRRASLTKETHAQEDRGLSLEDVENAACSDSVSEERENTI